MLLLLIGTLVYNQFSLVLVYFNKYNYLPNLLSFKFETETLFEEYFYFQIFLSVYNVYHIVPPNTLSFINCFLLIVPLFPIFVLINFTLFTGNIYL